VSYTYDKAGNRQVKTVDGAASSYGYASGFQLTSVSGASPESYSYDADGRVASVERDGVSWTLSYDAEDRLLAVSDTATGNPVVNYQIQHLRTFRPADRVQRWLPEQEEAYS